MERYAHFDTGLEYTFWFGIELSDDTECFGGRRTITTEWFADEDSERVMEGLQELANEYNYTLPDFNEYEENEDGTDKLYKDLISKQGTSKNYSKFCFGCLVYHQLTYNWNLRCEYEM